MVLTQAIGFQTVVSKAGDNKSKKRSKKEHKNEECKRKKRRRRDAQIKIAPGGHKIEAQPPTKGILRRIDWEEGLKREEHAVRRKHGERRDEHGGREM
jgi:hypothetical protein